MFTARFVLTFDADERLTCKLTLFRHERPSVNTGSEPKDDTQQQRTETRELTNDIAYDFTTALYAARDKQRLLKVAWEEAQEEN